MCLAPRVYKDKVKQLKYEAKQLEVKKYLDKRVLAAEERRLFEFESRVEFCGGDYDEILNEAEKSRLIYILFHKLELKSLKNTLAALPPDRFKRLDDKETMLNFLMRLNLLEELVPLHSKSKVIRAQREGSEVGNSKLKQGAKNLLNFFVDVNSIREYYGDEVAIYFEWMNYFQKWLLIPAVLAVIVFVGDSFFFDYTVSPLAGIFSVFMAIWGTLYITNWRRHTYELNTLWDDYVV